MSCRVNYRALWRALRMAGLLFFLLFLFWEFFSPLNQYTERLLLLALELLFWALIVVASTFAIAGIMEHGEIEHGEQLKRGSRN